MAINLLRRALARLRPRRHRDIESFDRDLDAAGGLAGRFDSGVKIVATHKVVGSVGRVHNLRSDFFYKTGQKVTDRFLRVGQAMRAGVPLPPLELYKIKRQQPGAAAPQASRYYVVDGHHRVAMARRLGQDFLDAHVVEYRTAGAADGGPSADKTPPAGGGDAMA